MNTKSTIMLSDKVNAQLIKHFFNSVTTTSCAFSPATNAMLVKKSATVEVTHCLTADVMAAVLRKHHPHSPSSVSLNRWKSEIAKSELYGWTVLPHPPRLAACSTFFQLTWGLELLFCKRKAVFFSDPAGRSSLQLSQRCDVVAWVYGLSRFRESIRITHFLSHKPVHISLPTANWTFSSVVNSRVATPWTTILSPAHGGNTTFHHW